MVIERSFSQSESDLVDFSEMPRFSEDLGSASSSPFVSAPSSPGRGSSSGYFFSAPASPMHFVLYSAPSSSTTRKAELEFPKHDSALSPSDFEFDFSSRLSSSSGPLGGGSMTSADELFSNGQILPVKLSSHLQRPQLLAPLLDLETEEDEDGDSQETKLADENINRGRDLKLRSSSVHRKARSLSPLRTILCDDKEEEEKENGEEDESERAKGVKECIRKLKEDYENDETKRNENITSAETTPSCSASSSRSSSSGRNSMKWIFLKDLLHRSKSEGRGNTKEKFWSNISFSPSKDKKLKSQSPTISKEEKSVPVSESTTEEATTETQTQKQKEKQKQKQKQKEATTSKKSQATTGGSSKPTNGIAKRRRGQQPSAHEVHYTTNRAQSEEMKKRTYLPYRHGLFGCLGFTSKGYTALNGLARSFNTVSSR